MDESQPVRIDDILAAFRTFDGTYQREMVDAALQRRDEIIPRLIAILEEIIADPEAFLEKEDRFDHIYAFMLLGHFKAISAHTAIAQVFSLKPKQVDDLFGEHTALGLPVVLLRTCGGDLRHIRIMALDRSLDTNCRLAAVQAMAYAVAAGMAVREEVTTFIASLFADAREEEDATFLSFAAIALLNLYPEEHMTLIREAFQEEIIDPTIVGLNSFEQALAKGKEYTLARLDREFRHFDIEDIHASMSTWACFDADEAWAAASAPQDLIDSGLYGRPQRNTSKQSAKALPKSRRKQPQTSKRKKRK